MATPILNKTGGVRSQMLPFSTNNGTDGTRAVDTPTPTPVESGPSRPPTPHGAGLPANFGEVVPGIYRSSYPLPVHYSSIARLGLKTIITLVKEPLSAEERELMGSKDINYYDIPILPNKTPGICSPQSAIDEVLKILLDPKNHPVLVHCNKGKHRTGCVIACLRRLQGWSMDAAVGEYLSYSFPKQRSLDQTYIANYDVTNLASLAEKFKVSSWKPSFAGPLNSPALDDDENDEEPEPPDGIRTSLSDVCKTKKNVDDNASL